MVYFLAITVFVEENGEKKFIKSKITKHFIHITGHAFNNLKAVGIFIINTHKLYIFL